MSPLTVLILIPLLTVLALTLPAWAAVEGQDLDRQGLEAVRLADSTTTNG